MKIKSAGQVSNGKAMPIKCKFIQAALNPEDTAYAGMYDFQSSWDRLQRGPAAEWFNPQGLKQRAAESKDAGLKESESLWGSYRAGYE